MSNAIAGFSKLSKQEKIDWIAKEYFLDPNEAQSVIKQYWNNDKALQQLHDDFIENTITNFYLPLGIAPNFLINGKNYTVPMVIEESSVVAAASKSAKYWSAREGIKTTVIGIEKIGQVHFLYKGKSDKLLRFFEIIKPKFYTETEHITKKMTSRGGGILEIELKDKTLSLENYYQIHVTFDTVDSMGANFINSCLEQIAKVLQREFVEFEDFISNEEQLEVIMSILSNYVPNCVVRAEVSCAIEDLKDKNIVDTLAFAEKFVQAVKIAKIEPFRAVTHNKGIMNGVDAVVLATGNDFRAIEAGVHAFASRNGHYSSLSDAKIENGRLFFWLDIPLALGTVGGLTALHPMVKFALQLLENPSAKELMQIVAAAGLMQNFAALRSLTTTGIQEGHMKMHINNILNQFQTSSEERKKIKIHFESQTITHAAVVDFIEKMRH
jgi:hydroxymethylglutaryl-CoA reductase